LTGLAQREVCAAASEESALTETELRLEAGDALGLQARDEELPVTPGLWEPGGAMPPATRLDE
jgi:hypothetical protein